MLSRKTARRRILRRFLVQKVQLGTNSIRFLAIFRYHGRIFFSKTTPILSTFHTCITYAMVAPKVRRAAAAALNWTIFRCMLGLPLPQAGKTILCGLLLCSVEVGKGKNVYLDYGQTLDVSFFPNPEFNRFKILFFT